ncbi:PLP-dependent aminotransferase family protein [Acrocarpospora macrocephala]|uniref:GntR family transcriptional regulator n=1 Tax=Acrocarpospora macrocephala TaxID=150177 RepID=A0A5M3X076_9ACTN|nr:PLP-dependent aminotransferase family protein [Acrocarpospora macrocephala]GES13539.1 GntR family transcriptional regulator [Acrocarpospora macrocephala]
MRNAQRLSVPIHLERPSARSLHEQLAEQLRKAIDAGQFAAGTRMPSTRTMAEVLEISRGVVVAAYEALLSEGYITGRKGSGTYVAARPHRKEHGPAAEPVEEEHSLIDMRPGRACTAGFPLTEWRSAWRRASHHVPFAGEPPPLGLPELRQAIALHLRDSRGLVPAQHEIVVTDGYASAVRLLVQALGRPVVIGLEDPAPPRTRAAFAAHGTVVPLVVDEEGAQPALIPDNCDIVVLMPERNDPLGVRMSPQRRQEIADWAAQNRRIVVEPASDGVFSVGSSPLPSILAIGDAGSTVMIGTFCEVLTPAVRVAYLVAPRHLAEVMADQVSERPSAVCQRASAELLRSGSVGRRLSRLSTLYQPKRLLIQAALGGFAEVGLAGPDSGSSMTLLLPGDVRAGEIVRMLRRNELIAADLADYCHPDGHHRNGVVIGYGHLDDMTLRRALRLITRALDDHGLARRTHRYRRTVA